MTLAFLELPAGERKVYIDEAAARRGLAPVAEQSVTHMLPSGPMGLG